MKVENAEVQKCGLCLTRISDLYVKKGKDVILKNINLDIHCGELTAVIGVNGAGKSTLLKALLGEVAHEGTIMHLETNQKMAKKPIIGYVPQKLEFDLSSPVSVLDIFAATKSKRPIWLGASKKVKASVLQSLERVQVDYLIDRQIGVLSGGELQRILLALALEPIPNILLLDEPVAGMDANGLKLFYETVAALRKKYHLSIILVSHDLDLVARYADKVVVLNKGEIINYGRPLEVFKSEVVKDLFDVNFLEEMEGSNK